MSLLNSWTSVSVISSVTVKLADHPSMKEKQKKTHHHTHTKGGGGS